MKYQNIKAPAGIAFKEPAGGARFGSGTYRLSKNRDTELGKELEEFRKILGGFLK